MLHKNHPFYSKFFDLMKDIASSSPAYDLGTNARFSKEVGLVRDLFDPTEYKAGGFEPSSLGHKDDCDFDCDIQNLESIKDSTVGSVICLSVLEHVVNPQMALSEIHRILKSGGLLIMSTPFFISYHGKSMVFSDSADKRIHYKSVKSSHESYSDFWRFTHEGIGLMLTKAGFTKFDIYPVDGFLIARLEILGIYKFLSRFSILNMLINCIDKPKLGRMTTAHFSVAVKDNKQC
jgi:SAM-dependent methyltransferase